MLKTDITWPDSRRFKSHSEWEPIGFFSEGFCNATHFDLKLGFFSSSAIRVLSDSFALFLYNGGRMRLVINDILSDLDRKAIAEGESSNALKAYDLHDLSSLKETLSERDTHFFECFAWLIRNNRIEIKIISPRNSERGISHYKCGCFSDSLNKVAFDGSCNFSRTALVENNESITAFCDWDGGRDEIKIKDIEADFERTFCGKDDDVVYLDAKDLESKLCNLFPAKDIEELLADDVNLLDKHTREVHMPATIRRILLKAQRKMQNVLENLKSSTDVVSEACETTYNKPQFPFPSGPRDYQKQAFANWCANQQKGLFAMATGTGKTLTALNCLLEIYKRKGYYKALILVPTLPLVEQWEKECRKFHFTRIYKVSSKSNAWRNDLDRLLIEERYGKSERASYVVISTYASFMKPQTFKQLTSFSRSQLLLIADEAHNMGCKRMCDLMDGIKYIRRIGLSATPERQFDEAGNAMVQVFFGVKNEQYTFDFSMREAIDKGYLCRYYYYPHLVRLSDVEMLQYVEISSKLAKFYYADKEGFSESSEILTRLLLKRKRIIHKAENKLRVFQQILESRYEAQGHLKYTLVYVPEGDQPDVAANEDFSAENDSQTIDSAYLIEGKHLIDLYTQVVHDVSPTITVREFTSQSKERDQLLADFACGRLDVLTSMKCLDEGVDVPRSELAIFCASTGNPRQFIQRRGRILRQHKDKHIATIHDLVVAPEVSYASDSYQMERNMLSNELRRVRDFALLSENADATYSALGEVLDYYELSL